MQVAYAFALVALLAFAAPAANARSLKQDSSSITDADILNFALNLECLEAQFYSCAVYGQPLSAQLTGNGPAPIGCQSANFTNDDIYSIAMDVANNEIAHVNYLRTALGNYSVQCPLVNIGSAFSDAANAVLNTTLSPPFSPYVNDLYFLHGAFIFEDVGVTAYKGALTSFQSKDIMLAAAGKHSILLCCFACSLPYLYPWNVPTALAILHASYSPRTACLTTISDVSFHDLQASWLLKLTTLDTFALPSLRTPML